jgi:hypothetical protein
MFQAFSTRSKTAPRDQSQLPMTGTQLQYPLGQVADLKARTLSRANSPISKGKWFNPDAIPRIL